MDSYSELYVEVNILFGAMVIHHTAKVIGHQSETIISDDDDRVVELCVLCGEVR